MPQFAWVFLLYPNQARTGTGNAFKAITWLGISPPSMFVSISHKKNTLWRNQGYYIMKIPKSATHRKMVSAAS